MDEQDQSIETPTTVEASDLTAEPGSEQAEQPVASRRGAVIALGVVVVLLAVFFVVAFAPKGKPQNGLLPSSDPAGYAAPALVLPKLDGSGTLDLASFKGKPVVVNFWASWCGPCQDEAALVAKTEKAWRDKGIVFIGIDSEDQNADALKFVKKYGIEYVSVVNQDGTQNAKWGVTGYPETFFIDRAGRIRSKFISSIDAATLTAGIKDLLQS